MPRVRRIDALRPRKQPLQARSRDTVDVILRAAARLLAAKGYAATTTNHIAEHAGVSIGSLYEYFPNKDALLVALMDAHLRQGEAIMAQAAGETLPHGDDVERVVRGFVRAMVDFHARDRALHRVLFEEAPLPPRIRRRLAALEQQVTDWVEAWLRAHPGVTRRDPHLAAAVVVQAVEGLTHKLVVYGERDEDIDAYLAEMVTLVTAYLAAP
jgi:AcrR family transcriptional regulator